MKNSIKFFAFLIAFQLNSVSTIHYGNKAVKSQFPYVVLVHSPQFFCSGALISNRHVLTAAHCLRSIRKGGKAKVNVGALEHYGMGSTDGKKIYSDKFWIHENFTMPSAVYDIGIIELPQPLVRSDSIQWVKLSTKLDADLDAEDNEVVLAGWGYTEDFNAHAFELRYTKMKLIPLKECKKFKSHYIEDMNKKHICTEKIEGMPCSGDSGSVLISTKTKRAIGIMSYVKDAENGVDIGYNDCDSKIPAVSTRISSYIDWINEKTGMNYRQDKIIENSNNINIDRERSIMTSTNNKLFSNRTIDFNNRSIV